ncbi:MAG: hypothetical protein ACR2L0_07880, partial [Gaiellaceae bacterium]
MRTPFLAVPAGLLVLLLAACGAGEPGAAEVGPPSASTPASVYEVGATVLESRGGPFPEHGPMLCLGAIADSYPTQCGDVPIVNWNWETVEGEERAGGAFWGKYHVVGTCDGETFTVTEVGPYEVDPPRSGSDIDFSSPCQEPAGGWVALDPKLGTQEHVSGASAYAESQPDVVTSWITQLDELGQVLFNAVFTRDIKRHEAEIRKRWPGPLCVVEGAGPTMRELDRIRAEAEAYVAGELGLRTLGSSSGGVEPGIEIDVVADPAGAG